jgi:ABC-type transport system involved in multi-copper enzyme maturation permease subunit
VIQFIIAHNTFREAIRDRVLAGMMAGGLVALLGTQVLSPLAMGEGFRLTIDLGLTIISALGMLVILMVGTNLVAKELEKRTIYNLLSRPIARWAYLVGKWAGLTATLWAVAGCLGAALLGLMAVRGFAVHPLAVIESVYLAALELTVMTAIAVLFSSFSTPVLSALYTLALYMVGQWSYDLRAFAEHFPPMLGGALQAVANVVPNLPIFDMRSLAANGQATTPEHLAVASLYALVYVARVLALAPAVFESRDFT